MAAERTAGATAISRVQAMALPQEVMIELIERDPKVATAAIASCVSACATPIRG